MEFIVWLVNGHTLFVEGLFDTGFRKHLRECAECRKNVIGDLKAFTAQLEKEYPQ
jgi:hypothetical protein